MIYIILLLLNMNVYAGDMMPSKINQTLLEVEKRSIMRQLHDIKIQGKGNYTSYNKASRLENRLRNIKMKESKRYKR